MQLIDISNKKYYNRPELSVKYSDLFLNIFSYISPQINDLKAREISFSLKGMINTGYNDKRFLHLLSTVYLKFTEKEEFTRLIYMMYYFAVCDLENSIFVKKTLEVLSLNLVCLENYLDGNDNLDNLVGLFDKSFVKNLNDNYMKNIDHSKDKIKYFEKIQFNEDDIFYVLDSLTKMMWSLTFYISKLKDIVPENFKQFINNAVKVFNYFISNLNTCEDNGIKIKVLKSNIDKIFQSYLFLLINSDKFSIKQNINLDFLKLNNLNIIDTSEDVYDYESFLKFKASVKKSIKFTELKSQEFTYEEDFSDIAQYNVFKFLKSDFIRIKEDEELNKITEIIFINDPFDYFEISMNYTGYNKFRKNLCNVLNLKYIEIDFSEFIIYYKDIEINNNYDQSVQDFLHFKLN